MKRIISALLIIMMLLCLAGCKRPVTDDTAVPSTKSQDTPKEDPPTEDEQQKDDAPPADTEDDFDIRNATVYVIEKDFLVLWLTNGDTPYGVRVNFDTSKHDIALFESVKIKANFKPLKIAEYYAEKLNGDSITVKYTAEFSDIVEFEFDRDNIDGHAFVLEKHEGYLIVDYIQRPIKVNCDNWDDFNVRDHIVICGDTKIVDTPIPCKDFHGFDNFIRYELNNASVKFDYMESEDGEIVAAKPVIYLYPQKTTDVDVSLDAKGKLTCVYPDYNGLWQVSAEPDGTLTDKAGREYYCLYWEAEFDTEFDNPMDTGFVVAGCDTAEFLRKKALALGLTEREANEFIIYWLPQMQNNKYNYIYFATDKYEKKAELKVSPAPDTTIRFMMLFKPLDKKISVKEQVLPKTPARRGFTVVEWGGCKLK